MVGDVVTLGGGALNDRRPPFRISPDIDALPAGVGGERSPRRRRCRSCHLIKQPPMSLRRIANSYYQNVFTFTSWSYAAIARAITGSRAR